jgi:hypothetical protein
MADALFRPSDDEYWVPNWQARSVLGARQS